MVIDHRGLHPAESKIVAGAKLTPSGTVAEWRAFPGNNLHTDGREIGAGAALTQVLQGLERVVVFSGHKVFRG